jgi:hypothetical protein
LVTRFLGVVLAATRLSVFVLAARLGALPRFSVAFRAALRFFAEPWLTSPTAAELDLFHPAMIPSVI